MTPPKKSACLLFGLMCCFLFPGPVLKAATGDKSMVVTPDARATQAGLEVLRQGGNAIDAAIAAQWVLNVVQPQASGIGGSGQILLYDAPMRRILYYDGNTRAPGEASRGLFLDGQGRLPPYRPDRNTGGLPVGVPGLLKLLQEIHFQYGTKKFTFEELFDPAIRMAEEGVEVCGPLAQALREETSRLSLSPISKKDLSGDNGQPLEEGQKFFQPELAKTLRLIQGNGTGVFYKGEIAEAMVRTVRNDPYAPGVLSLRDLEKYAAVRRDPVHGNYHGYDLFSLGAPASGGILLLRGLNVLSSFDVSGLGRTTDIFHLLEEVQKIALTNRAAIADPDFFNIPEKELLSQAWAKAKAGSIQLDKASKENVTPNPALESMKRPARASILAADAQGNRVILSSSLGDAFGSAIKVPGYGFFLNNSLTDFDADLASVNDPGAANVVAPDQRPRNAAAPLFAFKEGRFALMLDAYGPDEPAAVLLNLIILKLDLGVTCEKALAAPRLVDAGGITQIESELYDDGLVRTFLELSGQTVEKKEDLGRVQMIFFEKDTGKMIGGSDPRGAGEAAGF
ncbi:MAG: gamma-glutamyltransferase family protein [Candidatus Omnitrophica bacterium]|nr:gamma-glutamyltransferase family protein [Candidatus Omnitrophota bacterium]